MIHGWANSTAKMSKSITRTQITDVITNKITINPGHDDNCHLQPAIGIIVIPTVILSILTVTTMIVLIIRCGPCSYRRCQASS